MDMKTTFTNQDGGAIIQGLIKTIQKNKDYLGELDGQIGDGDHGINMNKGFTLCETKLAGTNSNMTRSFEVLSQTLMEDIGGSMGPLYGVFFEAMGEKSEGRDEIDGATFDEMLKEAVAQVEDIGNAKRGDKSLLETILPAQEAFSAALAAGKDFYTAIGEMRDAAENGWKSTKNMVAKIGRASRLGERSRGFLDPGATSSYLMLDSMAASVRALLQ